MGAGGEPRRDPGVGGGGSAWAVRRESSTRNGGRERARTVRRVTLTLGSRNRRAVPRGRQPRPRRKRGVRPLPPLVRAFAPEAASAPRFLHAGVRTPCWGELRALEGGLGEALHAAQASGDPPDSSRTAPSQGQRSQEVGPAHLIGHPMGLPQLAEPALPPITASEGCGRRRKAKRGQATTRAHEAQRSAEGLLHTRSWKRWRSPMRARGGRLW